MATLTAGERAQKRRPGRLPAKSMRRRVAQGDALHGACGPGAGPAPPKRFKLHWMCVDIEYNSP